MQTNVEGKRDFHDMLTVLKRTFSQLIDLVVQHISPQQLERLVDLIISRLTCECMELGDAIEKLQKLNTVNKVFRFLQANHFCGYLNYEILRVITPLYDDKCKEELEKYEKAFIAFAKVARLDLLIKEHCEHPEHAPQSPPFGMPQLRIEADDSYLKRTLYFIYTALSEAFSAALHLMPVKIERHCIRLSFSILPCDLASVERDLADSNNRDFLKQIGIRVELNTFTQPGAPGKKIHFVHLQIALQSVYPGDVP